MDTIKTVNPLMQRRLQVMIGSQESGISRKRRHMHIISACHKDYFNGSCITAIIHGGWRPFRC